MANNSSEDEFDGDFEEVENDAESESTLDTAQAIKARSLELRRKIEDRLERKRMRDEYGFEYDDWDD